jgi:hypothetical protein
MRRAIGTTIRRPFGEQASLRSRIGFDITNCVYQSSVPLLGGIIPSPATIRTSRPVKQTGLVSCDVPTATPLALCKSIPND